jgi:hypothetical protein
MTTKELIEMLQREDPDGTCHIRGFSGIITGVESKPGYWDGPYDYIEKDKDGNPVWVASTRGSKIDFYQMDLYDFTGRYGGNWEEVKKHIRVEYDYLDDGERERQFMEKAKKECEEFNEVHESVYQMSLEMCRRDAKKGYTWFQNKDVDKNEKPNFHKHYTWKIYDEKGKERMSTIGSTEPIMKSGEWEKVDNNKKKGYYQWIYKN